MLGMATDNPEVLEGDGISHEAAEKEKSESHGCENQRSDNSANFSIIDESSLIHEGKFSIFDVETLEGFSSDNDCDFSDDEDDIFCDDYGFLAEDDLAYEEFEHTRQVNAERSNNEPCRLEDILNRLDDSREESGENAGIAFQEGEFGDGDLQKLSDEGDEKEVAQNDRLLSRKCMQGDYGIRRYLVTGDIVEGCTYPSMRKGPILVSTNRGPYAYKLHELPPTQVQDIYKKLFTPLPSVKFGNIYRFNSSSDTWCLFWEAERLAELTTFSLISVICGALNSRRQLHWGIGIDRRRRIEGCVMTNEQRDTVRQAFVYCIRSGIVPQLDPDHVQLKFVPVESFRDDGNTRLLITITTDSKVSKLYQLSSGEIFYVLRNELKQVEGGMNEVSRMLSFKENKDLCVISGLDPSGYQRCKLKTDSVIGPMKISLLLLLGVCVAYCARRIVIYL